MARWTVSPISIDVGSSASPLSLHLFQSHHPLHGYFQGFQREFRTGAVIRDHAVVIDAGSEIESVFEAGGLVPEGLHQGQTQGAIRADGEQTAEHVVARGTRYRVPHQTHGLVGGGLCQPQAIAGAAARCRPRVDRAQRPGRCDRPPGAD